MTAWFEKMNDEKLIEVVRNYPCLYDKNHADFKDREKKRRTWIKIAHHLNADENAVMRRWGNLRERYSKEIRGSRNTSGSGTSLGRPWPLLESLQFLKSHIIPRPMRQSAPLLEGNVECKPNIEILNDFCESSSSAPVWSSQATPIPPEQLSSTSPTPSASSKPRTKKRRSAQFDELNTTIQEALKNFKEVCASKPHQEEISAEISGFGKMICSTISKMKRKNQALVMRRCTDIVMQARIEELEEVQEELN